MYFPQFLPFRPFTTPFYHFFSVQTTPSPPLALQDDKMGHYAPRKILQSSPDKPDWRWCWCLYGRKALLFSVKEVVLVPYRWRRRWRNSTHSTAHALDIISHVTLIFESSRYVDCIRRVPQLLPRNIHPPLHPLPPPPTHTLLPNTPSFFPSFLP